MLDKDTFKHPSAEYRIHPFWFWNGEMSDEQIEIQIAEMAAQGIGGIFPSPRQGLTIPYLSEAWFRKIKFAVEVAAKHGLHVWLYDEYPYPSGIAGGEVVLEHPDAKHYTLEYRKCRASGEEEVVLELPWGRTVSATAVPVDPASGERQWERAIDIGRHIGNLQADPVFQKTGLTAYNNKRFFTYRTIKKLQWQAPAGEWEVHVFLEAEIEDYKYYGTFVDFGHAEAMKTFIRLTHERYKQAVGEHFGKTVKGMFTDEIGYLGRLPWSAKLPEFFQNANGYSLKRHMQALDDASYPDAAKIRYDYFQAAHLLLRETYHKLVHDWCEENGLQYVAEVPSMRLTTQLYSHVVGSDSAHEKLGRSLEWVIDKSYPHFRSNTKAASSLARQLGRERVLCECFHSIGWSMTLQDSKWMIDRMAATGVNFFNFHSFFYTLDGLAKHDAPPSQFLQAPYWKHFRALGDYVGRISYVMSQGAAVIPIAYLDPMTSFWTHMGNPMNGTVHEVDYVGGDPAEKRRLNRLKRDWLALMKELTLRQRDYDHLDPETLIQAEIGDGQIKLGSARYSILVLPPMCNLEAAAWEQVKRFIQSGGTVIAAGLLPYEKIEAGTPPESELLDVFGLPDSPQASYWGETQPSSKLQPLYKGARNAYFLSPSADDGDYAARLIPLLDRLAPAEVRLGEGNDTAGFMLQYRSIGDSYVAFIANHDGAETDLPLYIRADLMAGREAEFTRLDLESGETEPMAAVKDANGWVVPLHFVPYQSYLIQIAASTNGAGGSQPQASADVHKLELDAQGDWDSTVHGLNTLRLETFDLSLGAAQGPSAGTRVSAKTFIDQMADIAAQQQLPIRFDQMFGTPMKMKLSYPISCSYTTQFTVEKLPSVCEMVMDKGAICGSYTIDLNGRKLTAADFRPKFVYDHLNQSSDVSPYVKPGRNVIRIEMEVAHDWEGVVDPIYLQGDFGVQFDSSHTPVLAAPPATSPLHGGPYPGYPYYAGTISFKRTVTLDELQLPGGPSFRLRFRNWDAQFHDCAQVIVNVHPLDVRAWTPYLWTGSSNVWKAGANTVEIQVTNTLIGMLEGKYFDYEAHQLKTV